MNLKEFIDVKNLLIAAIIVTFVSSAVIVIWDSYFCPEDAKKGTIRKKSTVSIIAVIVTLLNSTFVTETVADIQKLLTTFLLTWSFAVLFYSYLGGKFITWVFSRIKEKFSTGGTLGV